MSNEKKYYAQINSKNIFVEIDIAPLQEDEYGSRNVQNIEVEKNYYDNWLNYGRNYYIYSNGEIVLNPNYDTEQLIKAKENKYAENNLKAKSARYNQEFTITVQNKECVFDTNEETQRDLLTAFDVCSTGTTYDGWVTNNGVELNLTMEDVVLIFQTFKEKSSVYQLWKTFKTAIDNANTIKQVEAIVINYEV